MGKILTTIDTILDTRLPMVGLIDKSLLNENGMQKYYTRKSDSFGHIGLEAFEGLYLGRRNNILPLSRPTSISYLLDSFIMDMKGDEDEDIILYINTFPYTFTSEQEIEFKRKLLPSVPNVSDIIMINDYLVDGRWLSENISLVIDYDGLTSVNRYIADSSVMKHNMLGITWFIPRLLKDKVSFADEDFDELIAGYAQITNVIDIDIPYFCYVPKQEKNK